VIFRAEEWLRALIHETIHYLGWDFSASRAAALVASNTILQDLWKGLPANLNLFVFESFCDSWATIFQILLLQSFSKKRNTIVSLLDQERRHSLAQCAKVLGHMGFSLEDFEKTGNNEKASKYREKTPILSYYVLKSAAMFFMDDFVGLFAEGNFRNGLNSYRSHEFQFPTATPRAENSAAKYYAKFLVESFRNKQYRFNLGLAEQWLKTEAPREYRESLRMSIVF